jgi:TIR domain-containing protein/pentapeptide repeat protein
MEDMTRKRAIELLRSGLNGIKEWNHWRKSTAPAMDIVLSDSNLSKANLPGANLVVADLSGSDLSQANLSDADLFGANLSGANLHKADLSGTNMLLANLTDADISHADVSHTVLGQAVLFNCDLRNSNFSNAHLRKTTIANCDLSNTIGLEDIVHSGPSSIGIDTIIQSEGQIPEIFLRGCGVPSWMVVVAKLADPKMSAGRISDILSTDVFAARTAGPLYFGGCFISYSHANAPAVDQLYEALQEEGLSTWLDRHDMDAGPMERQVFDAIRVNDVVLLVLSEASLQSDWVWNEINAARTKEKEQTRHVLCPIALDDSWQSPRVDKERHMIYLRDRNILDFSDWDGKRSAEPFQKLLRGLKKYYLSP